MEHWQLKCKTVMERIAHILKTGLISDCTLQVGSSERNQLFKAHKTIMAAASPVLYDIVYDAQAETQQPIVISDVEPATFNSLLGYIYTDRVDIKSIEGACQLYYAANKYMLPGLQEVCMQYITTRHITPSNVCQVYQLAKFSETSGLKEECLKMFSEESEAVLEDKAFMTAELQTVIDIYSLPQLDIPSELLLLKTIEKYEAHTQLTVSAICKEKSEKGSKQMSRLSVCIGELPTGSIVTSHNIATKKLTQARGKNKLGSDICEEKREKESKQMSRLSVRIGELPTGIIVTSHELATTLKKLTQASVKKISGPSIRHAVQQIRFLSLTPEEFNGNVTSTTLLTKDEKNALLKNITSSSPDVAVPEGFSTSRVSRRDSRPVVSLNGTKHCYFRCEGEQHKEDVMRELIYWNSVIFCSDVERMREIVKEWRYITSLVIHEDMPTTQIDTTIQQVYRVEGHLIASPSLAPRINMKRVRRCINYEVPTVEGYRHTVARRYYYGRPPLTISLVSGDELEVVRGIQLMYGIHMEEIPGSGDIDRAVRDYWKKK